MLKRSPIEYDCITTSDGIQITISKKRIKNIHLRISRTGEVSVSAPVRCSIDAILKFVHQKESWIKTKVEELKRHHKPVQPEENPNCWFLGHCYPVKIREHEQRAQIRLEEGHVLCLINSASSKEMIPRLLSNWHRMEMQARLPDLIKKWETIIGVTVNEWRIRAMVSRWGSCHPRHKRICLNLYLIQKPLICLEYVLVHEMVHILEASHNQRFYALMNCFMPEWRTYKHMLSEIDIG